MCWGGMRWNRMGMGWDGMGCDFGYYVVVD